MADFESMTDAELRKFRSEKWHEIRRIRDEMRAAGAVLERKRAEAYAEQEAAGMAERASGAVDVAEALVNAAAADASSEAERPG